MSGIKLYVVVPGGDARFAKEVQDAGAIPLALPPGAEVDGHPVARGATGKETLALVQRHVAEGRKPLAMGGLDKATMQACLAAGAAGFILAEAVWLVPGAPLSDADKAALARPPPSGPWVLPTSGLHVARDALLAPFYARRGGSLEGALAVILADAGATLAPAPPATPAPAPPAALAPAPTGTSVATVLDKVVALVAERTGYPRDVLDPSLDMEADLGIDTVKQAEIFGQIRESFGVPRDEDLRLKDIPTLQKLAEYIAARASGAPTPSAPPAPSSLPAAPAARPATVTPPPAPAVAPLAPPPPGGFETRPPEEAVAIIGLGAVLPKANDATTFWQNVLAKTNGIVEVPRTRWDPAIHYDPDPAREDKTYAKIGGFVTDFSFDPLKFRIPPATARALDPVQQMALTAAAEALADAGYDKKTFDRTRCAVILGNSLGGEMKDETNKRMHLAEFAASLQRHGVPDATLHAAQADIKATLPPITEDTMPGELSNVIAGRLANVLNLAGKNLTTDAACASSHAALDTAVKAILGGEADMVLCGGADRSMDPGTYVKFCKIGALSAKGSTPFDARADGFVMGEGVAILLLKRLSDAVRDGDRIYCVVRGMGSSSDGKGKGITAPNPEGQKLAVKRAFHVAEVEPRHVQLVEAHGTSTKVGDVVEVESLAEIFKGRTPGSVWLGSVKSQIGHLKSAAGAAGILKVAKALHHKTLPPSANFETPNPNIKWAEVPFRVITEARPWEAPANGEPRRASVSAFGFGGTNFHVILEEYLPSYHLARAAAPEPPAATPRPAPRAPLLQGESVLVAADAPPALLAEIHAAAARAEAAPDLPAAAASARTPGGPAKRHRFAFGVTDKAALVQGLKTAAAVLPDPKARAGLPLKVKGASYGEGPRHAGKVAFLFPGQGSQYVNMCAELAKRYPVVQRTFEEADEVLLPLIGNRLTALLFVDPSDKAAVQRAEESLRQTEVTQPAMLAADVAIFRLLGEHGVRPDMVAGHSLGEYAALVAGGVLSFKDALLAVSARGKEMASVHVDDKGLMASFSCSPERAEGVLRAVEGYVVAANKNCPIQTVIAGATPAVKAAIQKAQAEGIEVVPLNVSAAFHTSIVAPASAPLRRVLERLEFRAPTVPVYTNVDATPYPADPSAMRDILARQVAAPVEWVRELHALHEAGARIFVEVGPKRALTGFVEATLGEKADVVGLMTNHPKRGDLASFLDALARLSTLGFDLGLPAGAPTLAPPPATTPAPAVPHPTTLPTPGADYAAFRDAVMPSIEAAMQQGFAKLTAEVARLRAATQAFERYGLVPCDVVVSGASMGLPGSARRVFDDENFERLFQGENRIDRLDAGWASRFLEKDIVRLVKGEGEPQLLPVKDATEVLKLAGRRGELDIEKDYGVDAKLARTLDVTSRLAMAAAYEALRDAGIPMVRETIVTKSGKTLPGDWVLPRELQDDTGIVFASAFPGYDNLVREVSSHLARRYAKRTLSELDALYHELLDAVPAERRARLSRFYAEHAHALHEAAGDEGALATFNRHFLFAVLSMGHAEIAETICARGPNTQVNAACASTTQAIGLAEDWMRTGRARRVIVVGADDVTSDHLLEWIGAGFLASGAATTAASVEEGALPFDRRRHGMIVGMGAVGVVLERREDVEARGMTPIARLLATRIVNSAYHGSRLDMTHIAGETRRLVETAARRLGTTPEALGAQTIFVSHETYTPARGGSASAEAAALRAAFGAGASQVLVTNTKGFTGHAMGAGLEDALAVKALQFNKVPPIANLRDTDPEFADLQLSRGGAHARRFAMRFSAGFGSQLALAFFEKMANGEARVVDPAKYQAFLDTSAGSAGARAERVGRALRITSHAGPPEPMHQMRPSPLPTPTLPHATPVPPPAAPTPKPVAPTAHVPAADVLQRVVQLVSEKTGYPVDVLDPSLDMEADLGIDTVKQAEIFGQLREQFQVPREEGLSLKAYPTLAKVAEYMSSRMAGGAPPAPAPAPVTAAAPSRVVPVAVPAATAPAEGPSVDDVQRKVVAIVAARTGYPPDMLDPSLDMEADLGIDTVKQAEIFGELRQAFAIPPIEGMNLKDVPTIAKVAALLAQHAGRPASPATTAAPPPATGPADPAGPTLVRRVPRIRPAPPAATRALPRAFVVGRGPLAEALRHHFPATTGELALFLDDARALFAFAKARAPDLEAGTLGILSVTEMGGTHGIDAVVAPGQGGVTGMTKALAAEFPKAFVRALDLDPSENVAQRLAHVEAELAIADSPVEVGRTAKARVTVGVTEAGPATGPGPTLPTGAVVVVTGGARGITAEVLKALAPQGPVLVLLGRTAAPRDEEADLGETGLAKLKEQAKASLAAKGERVTPVAIEKAVAPARARAEVARSMRALRAAGANVEYVACDVGDGDALARVLDDVRAKRGRIDGVLHAAGVEESRRLADKDDAAFARAWGPKAEAAFHLARLTEKDALRFFVMFGSVAGRFGNAAQADYAAANDAIAKLARQLRARGTPAVVMAWGPWGETGMATRGSTLTVLKAAGVEPITTTEGVGAFLAELARLDEPEVVLAKGLGALAAKAPGDAAGVTLTRTLRAEDPALDHHRVDGVPYLAGVLGLQAFLETSPTPVAGFEDVHFAYPVKLLRDQPVEVTVRLGPDGAAELSTLPPGPVRQPRTHFRARLVAVVTGAPAPRAFEGAPWAFEAIYPPFFHGPAFRVLARATRVAPDGIEVEGAAPASGIPSAAAVLEGAFQALGLWGLAVGRAMALPERVARVALHGPFVPGSTVYRVFGAKVHEGRVVGDVQCVVGDKVVATLEGIHLVVTGPSPLEAPPVWRHTRAEIAGPSTTPGQPLVLVPVEDSRRLDASPTTWDAFLAPAEQDALKGFGVAKRREEWLAATLAAKTALRLAGDARPWPSVVIARGEDRAPLPHGDRGLTLSHAGGVAVASVYDPRLGRLGVDVETVEPRAATWEEESFSDEERAAFPSGAERPAATTLAWAAKEAVLKALGVGLSVPARSVHVKLRQEGAEIDLSGAARERFDALAGESLRVAARQDGGTALAVAWLRVAPRDGQNT